MVAPAERYLRQVKAIVLEHLRGYDAAVYRFGSRGGGRARRASDVDVAIEPRRPLPRSLLAELQERLEECAVPYRVDIVDLGEVDKPFRRRVKREGVRWAG